MAISDPGPRSRPVVVILSLGPSSRPGRLIAALSQRAVEVRIALDTPSLMAELAAAGAGAMVIHEPVEQAHIEHLLAVVRRFYPCLACWRYDPHGADGRPQLCRIAPGFPGSPPGPAKSVEPQSAGSRSLPIGPRGGLLSPDELAMLLGTETATPVQP